MWKVCVGIHAPSEWKQAAPLIIERVLNNGERGQLLITRKVSRFEFSTFSSLPLTPPPSPPLVFLRSSLGSVRRSKEMQLRKASVRLFLKKITSEEKKRVCVCVCVCVFTPLKWAHCAGMDHALRLLTGKCIYYVSHIIPLSLLSSWEICICLWRRSVAALNVLAAHPH